MCLLSLIDVGSGFTAYVVFLFFSEGTRVTRVTRVTRKGLQVRLGYKGYKGYKKNAFSQEVRLLIKNYQCTKEEI